MRTYLLPVCVGCILLYFGYDLYALAQYAVIEEGRSQELSSIRSWNDDLTPFSLFAGEFRYAVAMMPSRDNTKQLYVVGTPKIDFHQTEQLTIPVGSSVVVLKKLPYVLPVESPRCLPADIALVLDEISTQQLPESTLPGYTLYYNDIYNKLILVGSYRWLPGPPADSPHNSTKAP